MATISQIKLGSTTYDIKDNSGLYVKKAGDTMTGDLFSTSAHMGFKNSAEADKFFDFGYANPTASTAPGAS